MSKQEAVRFEIEIFQIELLDVKGERREQSMRAYRKLVKLQTRPVHIARTDEQSTHAHALACTKQENRKRQTPRILCLDPW